MFAAELFNVSDKMHSTLQQLLKYKNNRVIKRYKKDYPDSNLTANEAFNELLKYIWLCVQHMADKRNNPNKTSLKFRCVMHIEMTDIDNMWHTFLLFTRDYQVFCDKYLGYFFHHQPAPIKLAKTSQKKYEAELSRYLSYIYDKLGEETLVKWFPH